MFRPRLIPVLLVRDKVLVKSVGFDDFTYVGDPINAVRMFDDLAADELVVLAIDEERKVGHDLLDLVRSLSSFLTIPLCAGGGVRDLAGVRALCEAGAEKVVIGSRAVEQPDFVSEAAVEFGSSTIAVCIDVRRDERGAAIVCRDRARIASEFEVVSFAELMARKGAGEILVQSVERDGRMCGYDLELIAEVAAAVPIPVVALGGAGTAEHLRQGYEAGASALASGSAFTFFRQRGAVLINYPGADERPV
jgi:cyclase